MTQSEFDFLREALAGKCDSLLRRIVEADTLVKQIREGEQKAKEQENVEEETNETKGE